MPASIVLILLAITPLAHPLAQAAPHLLSISQKVDNEIPQVFARLNPVSQKVSQIAAHIAVPAVPSLG
ncbi:hypothetical protein [Bradyrhizobium sp. Leo121]|uniref:hypothetical protein n=1 Tax=Bradyrhizobium sp. Leo121 TaxID=1571195 RepID=UPI0013EF16FC|nr:hypothetical protein [Bradyrhizobium sp. Leo121]